MNTLKRNNGLEENGRQHQRRRVDDNNGGGGGGGGLGDDVFDQIMGDMHKQKEFSVQGRSVRSTFSFESVIQKIIELTAQGEDVVENIEVEARVGLFSTEGFRSGAIEVDWKALIRHLSGRFGPPVKTTETDYIYDDCRIVLDNTTGRVLRKESKADKSSFDLSTTLIYDIRVSVSVEHQQPPPLSPPGDYKFFRAKTRFTYTDETWKIDLTCVREHVPPELDHPKKETFEVEVELLPSAIKQCATRDSLSHLLNTFLNEVKSLITKIQPTHALSFPDIEMEKATDAKEVYALKDIVFKYISNANPLKHDIFPGSMPINFGKKLFQTVQNGDYYVSEKTDEAIRNNITGPFFNNFERTNPRDAESAPFLVWGKNIIKKTNITDVFKFIKTDHEGNRAYIDHKRNHFTDGVIFTPNTAYTPYTAHDLFKWKYMDKWTIDFKLTDRMSKGAWYLSCMGPNNMDVDIRAVNFDDNDLGRVVRDYQRARDPNAFIVECSFTPSTGRWKFHQTRLDKIKANYITIVMDTMESIAEAITSEELIYRIQSKPDSDNWEDEMSKLRSKMLSQLRSAPVPAPIKSNHTYIPTPAPIHSAVANTAYNRGTSFQGDLFGVGDEEEEQHPYNPPAQQEYVYDNDAFEEVDQDDE
eukprot:gene9730-11363_t